MKLTARKYTALDMIRLPLLAVPLYSVVNTLFSTVGALIPTLNIFVTAAFVNTALDAVNGRVPRQAIYGPVAWILIMLLYNTLSGTASELIASRTRILCRRRLKPLMVERVARLEYKHIENTKTADLIARVAPSFHTQVPEMFTRMLNVMENVLFVAGILVTLFTQVWWVALCLAAASVPIVIVATRAGRRSYDADKEMTKIDRRVNYLSDVMKNRDATDERTVYGYAAALNGEYAEKFHFARKFRLKVSLGNFIKNKMGGVICSLVATFTMLAMLKPVASGGIDYGMFVGLIGGVLALSSRLSWGVNWLVEDISRKREYLKDMTEFMSLSEVPDATCLPAEHMTFERIEFKRVSFAYPGTEQLVLDKVSLVIENGRHYSFVGVNGAGKTTLTKLLTGLYTNYEGEILVDGRELRSFSQAEVKALSSVVYQDFARYFLTLYENIALSLEGVRAKDEARTRREVEEAVALVDLTGAVGKLKNGLDTPLGKIHDDGVDLSGGEWQRAAMARSVVSLAPLRILDEPTAALDPINESNVYHKFEQISRGRTTVFISHRLGSTKLADTIYVLSEGKIAETGSHDELLSQNGLYAEMYRAQASWYAQGEASHA